jgi:hypothetical protein
VKADADGNDSARIRMELSSFIVGVEIYLCGINDDEVSSQGLVGCESIQIRKANEIDVELYSTVLYQYQINDEMGWLKFVNSKKMTNGWLDGSFFA